jgi:hypothetical protein
MKSLTSLCLLPFHCFAMIQIQSPYLEQASVVKSIFQDRYKIPSRLINIKINNEPCIDEIKEVALSLCINKKRELLVLSQDIKMLKESFKVFSTPTRGAR